MSGPKEIKTQFEMESESGNVQKSAEKLAQFSIQKQLQNLRLKEAIIIGSFILVSGIGRILMQGLPSVEPIIFFAVLAGWLFGSKKGFIVGATSLVLSNFFVFGGQGPWTVFQALGFGVAGFIGSFLRKKAKIFESMIAMILATLIFEIIVDIGSVIYNPANIFTTFFLALPFLAIHVVSNSIFSLALPKAKEFVEKRGHFDEREIYNEFLAKFRRKKHER